jgi:phospholipid/cholesterol/gamma-HCH transport system substrate-binding protein
MKTRITAFRLGVFIIATLLLLSSGIFLIGDKKFLFSSTYRLNAEFQNVAGLIEGAPVRVRGIHKGTVTRIILPKTPNGKVTISMNLDSETRDIVKKDSIASIQSEGLLGDKYVEISFGSAEAGWVKSGETIGSKPPIDISNLIDKTNDILDSTKEAVQNAAEATGDLKSITAKINGGKGTVGALINDPTMYAQATAGATAFRENMDALKQNFLLRGFFKKRGYEDSSELTKNAISHLPPGPPLKAFTYDAKQIFDKPDSAKLKNEKSLNDAGKFLESEKFGLAIVTAYAGARGDSNKQRELTEARAAVVREYLVGHFECDDKRIKTLGLGKGKDPDESDRVEIVLYAGTQAVPGGNSSRNAPRP